MTPDMRRYTGCLLGGAVGDALGAPVEFMKRKVILERFGPAGIRDFAPAYGRVGAITDDTQMTLFTAEGLIRAWVRALDRGNTSWEAVVAHAYQRWLRTQGSTNRRLTPFRDSDGWLFSQRELHHARAPGNTCLSALQSMPSYGEPAVNSSKGCGGVMRVAPVGLMFANLDVPDPERAAFDVAVELAALTHGHPTGSLSAGAFSLMVHTLARGGTMREGIDAARARLADAVQHEETLDALDRAVRLADSGTDRVAAIAKLGQGWIAEEALAIAVYCALVAEDFADGVRLAVNHDGDSDSTGAMVGNLLGAMLGVEAIPPAWLAQLELREVIESLAKDLAACSTWRIGYAGSADHAWVLDKYPPT